MFGRVAGASLRALAVVGLAATAVAVVDVVDPGEVPTASASVVDGFTPNVPCDFTFNFWGAVERIANNDVYDRDALAWFPTQPLFTTLDVGGRGVLDNDQIDDWTLKPAPSNSEVAVASPPRFAQSFTMDTDGSFTYVPQPGYYGADSFTYVFHTNNGPCSNIGVVTILPVKRVRAIDDSYTTSVDTPLEVGKFVCGFTCGVIDNDVFPDTSRSVRVNTGIDRVFPFLVNGPVITVTDGDGVTFRTRNGTVSRLQRNGSFVYTPDAGFQGTERFMYSTSTIGAGAQVLSTSLGGHLGNDRNLYGTVTITVGPAPETTGPRGVADEFSTNEDTPLQITSAQLRANDPSLNYVTSVGQMFFQGQTQVPTANGRLDVSWISLVPGNPLSPQYVFAMTYTPNRNFEGVDWFSYAGRLGIPGDVSTDIPVSIRVTGTDDAPTPQHDTVTTDEDVPITIDAAANDTDPDGDLVRTSVAEDPCTVNMCAPAGWLNERHGTWVVNGDGTITYTPEPNYVGPATFLYEISDARGAKGYARVTVDVRSNNAMDDRYTTSEDTELVIAAPGVLANDEGEATSAEVVTPPSGTLALNADGSFRYRPLANAYGTDSFTYRAGGDLALVVIDVTPVSDPVSLSLNSGCIGNEPTDQFVLVCLASYDDRDVNEGGTAYVRGRIVDIDDTPGTLVVNWGDGSPTQHLPYPCTGAGCVVEIDNEQCWEGLMCQPDALYFTLTHTYADDPPGTEPLFRVSVTAAEQSGLFNTQRAFVRVRNTDVVPDSPVNLVPTLVGGGRVSVAFAPPPSDGGAPISLYRAVCSSPGRESRSASGTASPLLVIGLAPGASYTCRAIAQNEIGWSKSSVPSSPVQVLGTPGVPTGVSATLSGTARLSVAFTPPVSDGGSPITSYRAVCSSPTGTARSAVGGSSPLLVTGLDTGASYSCVVAALNALGSSGPSSASSPVAVLSAPPSPTGVTVTPTTTGRFSVSFIPPETDGGSPITSYRVVCSSLTGTARSATGASSPIVVTSLTVGASYTCRASATNAIGTSAPSQPSAAIAAR